MALVAAALLVLQPAGNAVSMSHVGSSCVGSSCGIGTGTIDTDDKSTTFGQVTNPLIYGATQIDMTNVDEDWLKDDQVKPMTASDQGMYNNYAAISANWPVFFSFIRNPKAC